jgi:ribosome maturation factor RimP
LKGRELEAHVSNLIEPLLQREGYELVAVEILGSGPATILRIYIDKQGGVSIDDCATVSEAVSAMLDVEDPIESNYDLEVSSPGLDRPLRKPSDYEKFAGQKVKIKTYGPLEGTDNRKMFPGILKGISGEKVSVDVDGTVFAVPLEAIAKANLVWGEEAAEEQGKKPKGKKGKK